MANNKVVHVLKQRAGAWKDTPLYKQASMACGVFFNKMHHYCTEGEKGRARALVRELFAELWPEESWPADKTWKAIGWRIGYELQVRDWFFKGKSGAGEFMEKYRRAMEYSPVEDGGMSADGWQLDGDNPTTAAKTAGNTVKSGKKGGLKVKINDLIESLGKGEVELECGVNSKGHTIMKGANGKVDVQAKKGACIYDLKVEYDRTVLFNRIQRWARKEDIFGE